MGAVRRTAFVSPLVVLVIALLLPPSTRSSPGPAAVMPLAMDTHLFRNVARRQNPTVVSIATRARIEVRFPDDEWLLPWLLDTPLRPQRRIEHGAGSGFLIGQNGEILTNDHVVAGADVIDVGLMSDQHRTYRAVVIGRDPLTDSALIRLLDAPPNLAVATLGDSDTLEPGDWVVAIGNPFQLGHTVTVGVVSYEGRPLQLAEGSWQKMIQTDASINPGNSGGPLLNSRGEVIGINSAIIDSAGGSIGIGFAVPINTVKALLPELRAGKVVRGRIGVQIRSAPLTGAEAASLGLPVTAGALITGVEPDSPASRSGLRPGDLVVEFGGRTVSAPDDFIARISAARPGTRAPLTTIRDGEKRVLHVVVAELVLEDEPDPIPIGDSSDFGVTFGDLTSSIARELELPARVGGAVVYALEPDGAAAEAGLQLGDVICRINRHAIHTAADATRALKSIAPGQSAFLLIWSGPQETLLELRRE